MTNAELRQVITNTHKGFDPFAMGREARLDSNVAIFGEAGSGKSVILKGLVCDLLAQNTKIFMLDINSSWWHFSKILNVETIRFNKNITSATEQRIFENLITVFEFEEIRNDFPLLKMSLESSLIQIMEQMRKNSEPFVIVVDDLFLVMNGIDSSLEKISKEIGQYNGRLVFSSNFESDVPSSILENCSRKIVISHLSS